MGLLFILCLLIFWGGIALLIMSHIGMIAIPFMTVLICWIIILVLFIAFMIAIINAQDLSEYDESYEEQIESYYTRSNQVNSDDA